MTSKRSGFKLIQRGADKTLLLIPGWATDHRIFASLDLPYDYLLPVEFALPDFGKRLLMALEKEMLGRISILGWSLGGFLAADFAANNKGRIDELILVGVKRGYKKTDIDKIKGYIRRNRAAYLRKFYDECPVEEGLKRVYLEEMDIATLMEGLDYLSGAEIIPERLKGLDVRFVHGENDRIAPIDEARALAKGLEGSEFSEIKGAGHFPCRQKRS